MNGEQNNQQVQTNQTNQVQAPVAQNPQPQEINPLLLKLMEEAKNAPAVEEKKKKEAFPFAPFLLTAFLIVQGIFFYKTYQDYEKKKLEDSKIEVKTTENTETTRSTKATTETTTKEKTTKVVSPETDVVEIPEGYIETSITPYMIEKDFKNPLKVRVFNIKEKILEKTVVEQAIELRFSSDTLVIKYYDKDGQVTKTLQKTKVRKAYFLHDDGSNKIIIYVVDTDGQIIEYVDNEINYDKTHDDLSNRKYPSFKSVSGNNKFTDLYVMGTEVIGRTPTGNRFFVRTGYQVRDNIAYIFNSGYITTNREIYLNGEIIKGTAKYILTNKITKDIQAIITDNNELINYNSKKGKLVKAGKKIDKIYKNGDNYLALMTSKTLEYIPNAEFMVVKED